MFARAFDYYRAASIAEAGELLRAHPGAKILAGGHSLIPMLNLRLASPAALIDIGRVTELKGISVERGVVRIGALTTHAELAASSVVNGSCPALAEAARLIGDPAVRNRGTIGGNVAHADPASDLPTVLTALDARFTIASGGRSVTRDATAFFTGLMTTALTEHDLLVAVEVPVRSPGQGQAYVKFSHPASRYAVIGVAAAVTVDGRTCTAAALALGGLTPWARRATSVERAIVGQMLTPEAIAGAAAKTTADLGADVLGDVFASTAYRTAVAPVWVKRALTAAAGRAT